MAEAEFERRLERLFAQAPELGDSAAFAERVQRRLSRGWAARRWLIGSAGVAGGVVGASQLVMSNVGEQVATAERAAGALATTLSRAAGAEMVSAFSGGFGVWIALGVAVLAMGFALSRVIEEF